MIIEYDDLLKQWVVWLKLGNVLEGKYSSKNKKDCEKYVKKEIVIGAEMFYEMPQE